ncbi:SRPBCC family protein [Microbacterium resistens]|nr:SRPBCC family protein [Microbacterium resistens]MBW1639339.1 SRPBCC family protein [Microbacterium resistens]
MPEGWSVSTSIGIDAAPAAVWGVLTDLDRAPTVLNGILSLERIGGPEGYAVGTRWRETRRLFGKTAAEEMEVAEIDPPYCTRIIASSHGADYVSIFHLDPAADGGTRLTMDFAATPVAGASRFSRMMQTLLGPLGISATRSAMRKDLEDIKRAAEHVP